MIEARPLKGETRVPGDKSISHRALMVGALASGQSRLRGLSSASDPMSTASCLRDLGIQVDFGTDEVVVHGKGLHGLRQCAHALDCGNSGTTMRLLAGILAGQPFESRLTGDGSLSKRPMIRVAEPLRAMGAGIELSSEGTAPFKINGQHPLKPLHFIATLPSAQVKSAVLLAGLFTDGETTVLEPTPTRDHTERMLGLSSEDTEQGRKVSVPAGRLPNPLDVQIPGDISAAIFLIGAAAIVPGSEVLVRDVGVNPGRAKVLSLLRDWGISIVETQTRMAGGEPVADLLVRSGHGTTTLEIAAKDVPACIDEIPALSCIALSAGVGFSVRGASELRAKESDRIQHLVMNFRAVGSAVEEYPDGFSFEGNSNPAAATIVTGGDHRIAMAFALAALRRPEIEIDDRQCVAVSFPEFFPTIARLQQPAPYRS